MRSTRIGKRPGPLSQEAKLSALDAQEGLEQCLTWARHFATGAEIFAAMNVHGQYERAQAWAHIFQSLDDCHRDLESMLPHFCLDRVVLFGIYQALRKLKERWIQQRIRDVHRPMLEPDGLDEDMRTVIREEEAHLSRLNDQFKRLVAAAP